MRNRRLRPALTLALCGLAVMLAMAVSGATPPRDPAAILTTKALRSLPPLPETDVIVPTGAVREFTLEAQVTEWEIVVGVKTEAYTFNGVTPGPSLRVTEGDLVRVTVVNRLPQPTSVHWHGMHVPFEMDGVPPFTQREIQPGESFTYEFLANHAGTFMYHSHAHEHSIEQNDRGLYGIFIVDPQNPAGHPEYDREYALMIGGWIVESDAQGGDAPAEHGSSSDPHRMDHRDGTAHGARHGPGYA